MEGELNKLEKQRKEKSELLQMTKTELLEAKKEHMKIIAMQEQTKKGEPPEASWLWTLVTSLSDWLWPSS